MAFDRTRRPRDPRDAAEAAFKSATTKPIESPTPRPKDPGSADANGLPNAKELVSLRIDRDILDHFQEGGTGWQDRINAALRIVAGR